MRRPVLRRPAGRCMHMPLSGNANSMSMRGPVLRRPVGWRPFAAAFVLLLLVSLSSASAAQPMPIMTTVGCVESGDNGRFRLVRATEPEALQERMPEQPPDDTPLGARTIRLIGTLEEFGVDDRTGHKVWAKGLLNPDAAGDEDLLNLTSITTLSDHCGF